MKIKIIYLITITLAITSVVLTTYFFIIKPNKSFNFNDVSLMSIEIIHEDQKNNISEIDYVDFLKGLNQLKYKNKNAGVKTRGEYFIIITYHNEVYEIGRYYSLINGENKNTLFNSNFDEFVESWFK